MTTNNLTSAPIPKLLRDLAIPSSIGFFFNTMYNVVDTLIAGRISTDALAALSISFPIFFILIAFGAGIGMGATALIGNALGENNPDLARRYAKQTISFGLLLSILVTIIGMLSAPYLLTVLGASGDYLVIASDYIVTIFWGAVTILFTFIFNAILNANGDTKSYRNMLIGSFFLNLLLSPVLAFGWLGFPAWGVFGIAIATIVTNGLGALYLLYKVQKTGLIAFKNTIIKAYLPDLSLYKEIVIQGFPAALSMMTVSVGAFIITFFVSKFGETAVAGYGTALRIEQVFLIPGIGINVAVLTLISQNNGAQKYDRVRETIKVAIRYSLYLGTFGAVCLLLFSSFLIGIFTDDQEVITQGVGYLYIAALITWAYGLLFVTDSVFRGLKKPAFPFVMGVIRQVILPLPVFWIATSLFAFGIFGIWWGLFAVVWAAAIIALFYVKRVVDTVCVDCTD